MLKRKYSAITTSNSNINKHKSAWHYLHSNVKVKIIFSMEDYSLNNMIFENVQDAACFFNCPYYKIHIAIVKNLLLFQSFQLRYVK